MSQRTAPRMVEQLKLFYNDVSCYRIISPDPHDVSCATKRNLPRCRYPSNRGLVVRARLRPCDASPAALAVVGSLQDTFGPLYGAYREASSQTLA